MGAVVALEPRRTIPRHERIRQHLRGAVELSFPLFTYKELKRMVRAQYHTFIMQLRETHTWEELSSLTGMTRAGLNKLGDVVPPKVDANSVRSVWLILERAGEEGLRLGELAAAFYERHDLDGPDLREAVQALVVSGEVVEVDGRYRVRDTDGRLAYDRDRVDSAVESVRAIADRVVEHQGLGSEGVARLSFRVCPEKAAEVYDRLREVLVEAATELECSDPAATEVTVVLAAAAETL